MYYRLRQREQTPAQLSLSVGLGTLIGCLPLFGLHLPLCIGFAKLLRLSAPIAYLAAHINNPWTAPFLLYFEATLGHRLTRGEWLRLDPQAFRDAGGLALGRDLLLGSVIVGVVLGTLLALLSLWTSTRWKRSEVRSQLVNRTSLRYQEFGLPTWEGVRAKLRHDPVYLGILRSVPLPPGGHLVDLGCGRGILLAVVRAAQDLAREDSWPEGWPPVPAELSLTGFEVDAKTAGKARLALGSDATIHTADLRGLELPQCNLVTLLDVLHYLDPPSQDDLLARVAGALEPGGAVLIREADADAGLPFLLTRIQERLSSWARLELRCGFAYRPADEWRRLLQGLELEVEVRPMAEGTPFANVMIEARSRPTAETAAVELPE